MCRLLLTFILFIVSSCQIDKIETTTNSQAPPLTFTTNSQAPPLTFKEKVLNSIKEDSVFVINMNISKLKRTSLFQEVLKLLEQESSLENIWIKKNITNLDGDFIFHANQKFCEIVYTGELFSWEDNFIKETFLPISFPTFKAYQLNNNLYLINYQGNTIIRFFYEKTQLNKNLFTQAKNPFFKKKNFDTNKYLTFYNAPALSILLEKTYNKFTSNNFKKTLTWKDIDLFLGLSSMKHSLLQEKNNFTYYWETRYTKKKGFIYDLINNTNLKDSTKLPIYAQKIFQNSHSFYYKKIDLNFLYKYILDYLKNPKLSEKLKPLANQAIQMINFYKLLFKSQFGLTLEQLFANLPKAFIVANSSSIIIEINKKIYDLITLLLKKDLKKNTQGFNELLKKDFKLYFNEKLIVLSTKTDILNSFTNTIKNSYKKTYKDILKQFKLPTTAIPYSWSMRKNKKGQFILMSIEYNEPTDSFSHKGYIKLYPN